MNKFKSAETIGFNDVIRNEKRTVRASIFLQTLVLVTKNKIKIHQDDKEFFSDIFLSIYN